MMTQSKMLILGAGLLSQVSGKVIEVQSVQQFNLEVTNCTDGFYAACSNPRNTYKYEHFEMYRKKNGNWETQVKLATDVYQITEPMKFMDASEEKFQIDENQTKDVKRKMWQIKRDERTCDSCGGNGKANWTVVSVFSGGRSKCKNCAGTGTPGRKQLITIQWKRGIYKLGEVEYKNTATVEDLMYKKVKPSYWSKKNDAGLWVPEIPSLTKGEHDLTWDKKLLLTSTEKAERLAKHEKRLAMDEKVKARQRMAPKPKYFTVSNGLPGFKIPDPRWR